MNETVGRRDGATWARLALVVAGALFLLVSYAGKDRAWTLLDEGILAIHEAGHLLFQPFGEFAMMLGGSLFQLIVPALFVAYFARRGDRYAAAVVLFWLTASLFNLATYIGDARAGELPLITGSRADHDWTWLLIQADALEQDRTIARVVRAGGWLCWAGGLLGGLHYADVRTSTAAADEQIVENSGAARTASGTSARSTGTNP